MNTELTLEYGKNLKNSRVLHQEMLCCHSSNAARVFKESQPLRTAYAAADKLRKDLKDFVSPNVSKEEFDLEHLENKACCPPQASAEARNDHLGTNWIRRRSLSSQKFMDTIHSSHISNTFRRLLTLLSSKKSVSDT